MGHCPVYCRVHSDGFSERQRSPHYTCVEHRGRGPSGTNGPQSTPPGPPHDHLEPHNRGVSRRVSVLDVFECLNISTSLTQLHWLNQWCESGVGLAVWSNNCRRGGFSCLENLFENSHYFWWFCLVVLWCQNYTSLNIHTINTSLLWLPMSKLLQISNTFGQINK